jgi:hypothetical protein
VKLRGLVVLALALVACSDNPIFSLVTGPPGDDGVDVTAMPLGTIAYFEVTDDHPSGDGDAESVEYAMESVTTDDPSVLRVIPESGGYLFVATGVGTTMLHLRSNQSWDLPVVVTEQP